MTSFKNRVEKLEKETIPVNDKPVFHIIRVIDPKDRDKEPTRWFTLERDGGLEREEEESLEGFKQRIIDRDPGKPVYMMICQ